MGGQGVKGWEIEEMFLFCSLLNHHTLRSRAAHMWFETIGHQLVFFVSGDFRNTSSVSLESPFHLRNFPFTKLTSTWNKATIYFFLEW